MCWKSWASKLSAVQAGLLLLQVQTHSSEFGRMIPQTPKVAHLRLSVLRSLIAATMTGFYAQIVALSGELGLGLDCDHWEVAKMGSEAYVKGSHGAVYMEHKWLALKDARPSHIDANNWEVLQLIEEDFPENMAMGIWKKGSSDHQREKRTSWI